MADRDDGSDLAARLTRLENLLALLLAAALVTYLGVKLGYIKLGAVT